LFAAFNTLEHRQKQLRNAYYKKLLVTYYLNISVQAANLSDYRIESNQNFFARIGMLYHRHQPPLPALGYELSPSHSRARVRTDTQSATTGDLSLSLAAASLLTAGALSRVGGYAGAAADERHRMSKRRRPANRTCCDLSECTDVSAPLY